MVVGQSSRPAHAPPPGAEPVSLVALIANPGAFEGRPVRIVGVAQLEFEQNVIYLTRDDYDHRVLTNAIGLSFGQRSLQPDDRGLSGSYVGVEGVFRAKRNGARGIPAGSIDEVTRMERWDPGSELRR